MSGHIIVRSVDANYWPTTRVGKKVRRPFVFKITWQHTNNWEVGILFTQCIVSPLLMSPHLGMDEYTIFFSMTKDMM
jgi:hypothetical protein